MLFDTPDRSAIPPRTRVPFWLLPNLLALDAPVVAVVWQRFLAAQFQVPVMIRTSIVLGLVVWVIYLTDRLLDAKRGESQTDRHRFAARWYRPLLALILVLFLIVGEVSIFLEEVIRQTGFRVAIGVVLYLLLIHTTTPRWLRRSAIKESLVGIGFAAGVAVPLIASAVPVLSWLPAVLAFGIVCWLNCLLIEHWESGSGSPRIAWALALIALGLCLALPWPLALAIGASVLLLLVVDRLWGKHAPRPARVLADIALLLPVLPFLMGV